MPWGNKHEKNAAIAAVYCSFAYFLARHLLKKHEWQLGKGCDWKPYHKQQKLMSHKGGNWDPVTKVLFE